MNTKLYTCRKCNASFDAKSGYFSKGKFRNQCKKCRNKYEASNRKKKTPEAKSELLRKSRKIYYKRKEELLNIEKGDFRLVQDWVARNRIRKGMKSGKDRNMSYAELEKVVLESIPVFPYMTFRTSDGPKAFLASIDRIDSSKGYESGNVVVVPLWFNSAKLDMGILDTLDLITEIDKANILGLYNRNT